jgi:hypothetical protein
VYNLPDTKTIQVSEITNILEWSKQNGYNYRDIKILNPWILSNTLPIWDWEIVVLKK